MQMANNFLTFNFVYPFLFVSTYSGYVLNSEMYQPLALVVCFQNYLNLGHPGFPLLRLLGPECWAGANVSATEL